MKIIFYKSKYGKPADKVVAMASFSKYSHCELLFPSGECMSSSIRDGGVRKKFIDIGERWDVFDLVGDFGEQAIEYWFRLHDGDTYDWVGAVGSAFGVDMTSDDKKFCSYVCAICLGLYPIVTPGSLFRTLKKRGMINVE